jgi:hypothetical protein
VILLTCTGLNGTGHSLSLYLYKGQGTDGLDLDPHNFKWVMVTLNMGISIW